MLASDATFRVVISPTPLVGPEDNGIVYGSGQDLNRMAEFFTPSMPVDPLIGIVPETLRQHPLGQHLAQAVVVGRLRERLLHQRQGLRGRHDDGEKPDGDRRIKAASPTPALKFQGGA